MSEPEDYQAAWRNCCEALHREIRYRRRLERQVRRMRLLHERTAAMVIPRGTAPYLASILRKRRAAAKETLDYCEQAERAAFDEIDNQDLMPLPWLDS